MKGENPYWNSNIEHTSYDDYWKARSIVRHLKSIAPAVLTVGGWFDAEDLAGPLNVYRSIEKNSPGAHNILAMGPWTHGSWSRGDGDRVGNLDFASKTSVYYREKIEFPFFAHHLKGKPDPRLPEAYIFETGTNRWRTYDVWPPSTAVKKSFYFGQAGTLSIESPPENSTEAFDEYVSDPNKPVPYLGYTAMGMRGDYMTEDQRFASTRPDVLVYETEPLAQDVTVAGPITVTLHVSTTGTDSDFVVKLIDVYPGDFPNPPEPAPQAGSPPAPRPANAVRMGGYQQLVRGEPFRGKFRNSFEKPEPFQPGKVARIEFTMPDVCHTFRKGHRMMVQVQSSWFPLVDRNPQKFVDIPRAKKEDFQKATQRVYRSRAASSSVTVMVMQ
jgi:putative CocE/NonD family hydrolase